MAYLLYLLKILPIDMKNILICYMIILQTEMYIVRLIKYKYATLGWWISFKFKKTTNLQHQNEHVEF